MSSVSVSKNWKINKLVLHSFSVSSDFFLNQELLGDLSEHSRNITLCIDKIMYSFYTTIKCLETCETSSITVCLKISLRGWFILNECTCNLCTFI